ncbi:helix-turn-helix domain-containing protein [Pseudorhodobacter sp. W20_MBD10_FR17]|uniref:helix-turn-helix domain-containing protein n=1 Tax=Pseudorhodobacter sp. W20_MBD10_FR17 TaxID=3240266 RepID=UPI003F97FC07
MHALQFVTNNYAHERSNATPYAESPYELIGGNSMYVTIPTTIAATSFSTNLYEQNKVLPETRLGQNSHLFRAGDKVSRIYQITSGVVSLARYLEDGRRQIISFGYPGDIVGFPHHEDHQTDCQALTLTTVQPFRLSQVNGDHADPKLQESFMKAAFEEIAGMQDHFMMLGCKSAHEKLASFLRVLASRAGTAIGQYTQVHVPMGRADIADFLGLTTETVSRIFTQLRKSRVIALDGPHTVIILRPEALLSPAVANQD